MIKFFDKIHGYLLNVIFPPYCNGCGKALLHNEKILCTHCIHNLPVTNHCKLNSSEIVNKFYGIIPVEFGISLLYFNKNGIVRQIIHNLKYKNQQKIGTYLADFFSEDLKNFEPFKSVNYIISVPIHKKRHYERGYNQIDTFCKGLSKNISVNYLPNLLIRTKYLKSQTSKSRKDRAENIKTAFLINNYSNLENNHFLIVDDVFTTGATIEACAKEILKIKNAKVSVLTIAYSQS